MSGGASSAPPPPPVRPPCALRPPGPKEGLASLLSTPATVPGPMSREGPVGLAPEGCNLPSPSKFTPAHRPAGLSSKGAAAREASRGHAQLNGRLRWSGGQCHASTGAHSSHAAGGGYFSGGGRA